MRYGPTYRLPCCLDLFYVFLALFDSTFFRFLWKLVVPRLLMPFLSFYIFVVVLYIQGAFFLPSSVSTRRAVSGKVFLLRFCTIRRERLSQDNLSEYLCLGRIGTTVCVYVCVCVCVCVGWMRMSDTLYSLKKSSSSSTFSIIYLRSRFLLDYRDGISELQPPQELLHLALHVFIPDNDMLRLRADVHLLRVQLELFD